MEPDQELLDAFAEEVMSLKPKLKAAVDSLKTNVNQPEQFLNFAQVIDGVYGTAMTLGFKEIGEYTYALRMMCRKCGTLKVPRALPEVFKMMSRCIEHFDTLNASIKNPAELAKIKKEIGLETARANRMDAEMFAYAKP